jgi:acetyl esterase/lipase
MATWKPDPEVSAVIAQLYAAAPRADPPALGDIETRRTNIKGMFTALGPPVAADVTITEHHISGSDGHKILGRLYKKQGAPTGASGILYLHGGGYIAGDLDIYDGFISKYVTNTGVPFFAPDYRLAPEASYPTNVDDAHKALLYLFDHAKEWKIDPRRIAIMGDSGGGGLAAALAVSLSSELVCKGGRS